MPTQPTLKPPKRETVLPLLAELVSRGDGTFLLKPKVPDQELDTWITIRQAAEFLDIHRHNNLYPFLGEYLVYRRPLPARIIVSLKSALPFKQATQDPNLCENPAPNKPLKQTSKQTIPTPPP